MTPVIDLPTFTALQGNTGADFVAELVDTFAAEAPGMQAELRAAWAAGAADAFRRAAHSLKTNAQTFGASHLADAARQLELHGLPPDAAALDMLDASCHEALAALQALAHG